MALSKLQEWIKGSDHFIWAPLSDKDHKQALYWFEEAAALNHADAENHLGAIYETGNGAVQDIEKAQIYFERGRAMDHGNASARASFNGLLAHGLPDEFGNK